MAARSNSWTIFTLSNTVIVGLNPTGGMNVCVHVFCVCVVLYVGSGLAMGWSLVRGVVRTMYGLRNWKKLPGPQGL
jgi:hypothetical protein